MPFYEYECQACKFYTEVMQKITDAPLAKCPSCGKRKLKKLVSAPVFRLKGGGWYETDFKGEGDKKRNLAGADKDEPKPEGKADAKAADTKADAKPAAADAKPAKEAKESKAAPEKPAAAKARAPTRNVRARPKKPAARKARR